MLLMRSTARYPPIKSECRNLVRVFQKAVATVRLTFILAAVIPWPQSGTMILS